MSKINGLVAIKHPTGAKMCFLELWPGNKHVYGIFFLSELENTFYFEIEKENLVQFR